MRNCLKRTMWACVQIYTKCENNSGIVWIWIKERFPVRLPPSATLQIIDQHESPQQMGKEHNTELKSTWNVLSVKFLLIVDLYCIFNIYKKIPFLWHCHNYSHPHRDLNNFFYGTMYFAYMPHSSCLTDLFILLLNTFWVQHTLRFFV